jgi:hypothetical protein
VTPVFLESRLLDGSACSALFSADERHRYLLTRQFPGGTTGPGPLFLMLNPSTATHEVSDPTVTRCAGFACRWGYGSFSVANLFSLRSTDPRALYRDGLAEGDPENLYQITLAALDAPLVLCAWGTHGALRGRSAFVRSRLDVAGVGPKLHYLALTNGGEPKHPLYLPGTSRPIALKENA